MKLILIVHIFFGVIAFTPLQGQQKVNFISADSVTVTADLYLTDNSRPYIVLCHLAGHSRAEYREVAKELNRQGYNCLALDARAGNEVFGVVNETAREARKNNKSVNYVDAEPDIVAAIEYAVKLAPDKSVALLGSSYSASLALKIGSNNAKVKAVLAFSPGEYFGDALNLKLSIQNISKPVFVTSSREESRTVKILIENIDSRNLVHFVPTGDGAHGSIALWKESPDNVEYWTAMLAFLSKYLKP
jgi:dienelactone hydrolase